MNLAFARLALLSVVIAGCSGGATAASPEPSGPRATPPSAAAPTAEALSVVCEAITSARPHILDAMTADIMGENSAVPTRAAIDAFRAVALSATDPVEKRDLTTLADAIDAATLSGGTFADWDPAYEAFYVKYATQCGMEIVN